MALSFYSNFEASSFQEAQSELSMELQAFQETEFNYSINPIFDKPQDDFFFQDSNFHYSDQIPCFSSDGGGLFYPNPPPPLFRQFSPEIEVPLLFDYEYGCCLPPPLPLPPPPVCFSPGVVEEKRKTVSGQSIAARQRRKKIAEKTQELGKLIPGGQKMNTAEMFQAAFNYVKFLQAQVGILQLMANVESEESEDGDEGFLLQSLASSAVVQEKLSTEKKCLVPERFVQTLADDPKIQSNPVISEELDRLMITNNDDS